jgi:2-polyprenyl-3-methyl-5-hydroxy-6-metoxy-1,4-benzoquinol methylase
MPCVMHHVGLPSINSRMSNTGHHQDGLYRPEMLKFLPLNAKAVLDVGCANGDFGQSVKKLCKAEVWGIEAKSTAAAVAKSKLDHFLSGTLEEVFTELPDNHFDAIYFNDVLEHLVEPEAMLQKLVAKLSPEGVFITSIPNVRYFRNLINLLVKKDWEYEEWGILDRTHLRFFTQKSILNMFQRLNFEVLRFEGINPTSSHRPYIYHFLTLGLFGLDTRFLQFASVVKPKNKK